MAIEIKTYPEISHRDIKRLMKRVQALYEEMATVKMRLSNVEVKVDISLTVSVTASL
ncbi:MAG: hypothetical protein ACRD5H_00075 [Nitrososphaerales archaeon]